MCSWADGLLLTSLVLPAPVLSKLAHAFRPWDLVWVNMCLCGVYLSSLSVGLLLYSLLLLQAWVFSGEKKECVIFGHVPWVQYTLCLFSQLA